MQHWEVPDSLEPSAILNFYYGCKGAKPTGGFPLYLYFHGSGPRDHEFSTGLKLARSFDDAPSAYFIPQIPNEGEWYRWYQRSKQWFIEKLLFSALESGLIDPYRIYMIGISEGGYGSQRLASFYADYLAGAGPMAGGEPLKNAPAENCSNIAFSLLTGSNDTGFYRNILTGYTRDAFDSLKTAYPGEFNHRTELLDGYDHHIPYKLMTPWLKQFKRNPWPRHFLWEDFEMDGRRREGFYNIIVNSRVSDLRQMYEVSIRGQRVDITVQDVQYLCTQLDPNWGIEMKFLRSFSNAEHGDISLMLNSQLLSLKKKVLVYVNGRLLFSGKPLPTESARRKSLMTFHDPLRVFPVEIPLKW